MNDFGRKLGLGLVCFSFSLLGLALRADGENTCGCECGFEIIGEMTNLVLGSCSSNCVRMTPGECDALKSNLTAYVDSITNDLSSLHESVEGVQWHLREMEDFANAASNAIENCIAVLPSTNTSDISSALASASTSLLALYQQAVNVDGTGTRFVYTNLTTGATVTLTNARKFSHRANLVSNYLHQAAQALQTFDSGLSSGLDSAKTYLQSSIEILSEIVYAAGMTRQYLYDMENYIVPDLQSRGEELRLAVQEIACESCGSGSPSSDGGGGPPVNIDITPIVVAVNELQLSFEYEIRRLYNLIQNLFIDYNNARTWRASGTTSAAGYSALGDNWFKRIEYLLYTMANSSWQSQEDIPSENSTPSTTDDVSEKSTEISSGITSDNSSLDASVSTSWNRLSTSLRAMINRLNVFGPSTSSGNLDSVILSGGDSNHRWELKPAEGFGSSSLLQKISLGFRLLWLFLAAGLNILFIFVYIKLLVKVGGWFLKIFSSNVE